MSGHRYETSILGEKNTKEMSQAPNDWNKYKQETQRTGKKRLLIDTGTEITLGNYEQRVTRGQS